MEGCGWKIRTIFQFIPDSINNLLWATENLKNKNSRKLNKNVKIVNPTELLEITLIESIIIYCGGWFHLDSWLSNFLRNILTLISIIWLFQLIVNHLNNNKYETWNREFRLASDIWVLADLHTKNIIRNEAMNKFCSEKVIMWSIRNTEGTSLKCIVIWIKFKIFGNLKNKKSMHLRTLKQVSIEFYAFHTKCR